MRRRIPRGREVFCVPFLARSLTIAVTMLLIGGYGAAQENQGQNQTPSENQNPGQSQNPGQNLTPVETATQDFLGMRFGAGVGVMGGFGGGAAVEKVSVVGTDKLVRVDEEGDLRPQVFLEMHTFSMGSKAKCWRDYQQKMGAWRSGATLAPDPAPAPGKERKDKCPKWTDDQTGKRQAPPMPDLPLMGFGPFVALQSSDDAAIDSLAVGLMMGRRFGTEGTNSLNIGIGFSFDPSVQVLGDGVEEGKALPPGESSVRLKKESQFGWALMISFSFL